MDRWRVLTLLGWDWMVAKGGAWLGSHGRMWPPRGSGHAHPREHCVPSSLEEQGQCKRQQGVGVDVGRDVGGCSRSS